MAKKILIVRFSSLGDVLLTTGIIGKLKQELPEASVDFLTYQQFSPLLESNPNITNLLTIKRNTSLLQLLKFYFQLPKYDLILDLHDSIRSNLLRLFNGNYIQYDKKSKERRNFIKDKVPNTALNDHITERYYKPIQNFLGLKQPTSLEQLRPELFLTQESETQVNLPDNFICIHPYASQKNKEWPYFKELCQELVQQKRTPVIIGQGDFPKVDGTIDLSNKTSLQETFQIIKRSAGLISTDSGPVHIGTALNKKIIGIFGPTSKELGFFPKFENCISIENTNIKCRPCHPHGGNQCPEGHFDCMKTIRPQQIIEAITF